MKPINVPTRRLAASRSSRDEGPREWSYSDLARARLPTKSVKRALKELGYRPPLTAREVYAVIERTYLISGAYYASRLPKWS